MTTPTSPLLSPRPPPRSPTVAGSGAPAVPPRSASAPGFAAASAGSATPLSPHGGEGGSGGGARTRPKPPEQMQAHVHPLLRMHKALLAAMRLTDEQAAEVLAATEKYWTKEDVQTRALEYDLEREIQKIQHDASFLLGRSRRSGAIIKVQSYYRMKLERRKYLSLKATQCIPRNILINRLVKEERDYTIHLSACIKNYLVPMRKYVKEHKNSPFSAQDLRNAFANYEELVNAHINMANNLAGLIEGWPNIEGRVGAVFLRLANSLNAYGPYVLNFRVSTDTLQRLCKDQKYNQYAEALRKQSESTFSLQDHLTLPLNRIPQYESDVHGILQSTPSEHADYQDLLEVASVMHNISQYVREMMDGADGRAAVLNLSRALVGADDALLERQTRVVCDGPATQVDKSKHSRHLFLFDDMLLLTKSDKKRYTYKAHYPLMQATTKELPDNLRGSSGLKNAIEFTVPPSTTLTLSFGSAEEKSKWSQELQNLTVNIRVFGVPLEEVLRRDGGQGKVPMVVAQIADYIGQNGMDLEGIFRMSGDANEVDLLRQTWAAGKNMDLSKNDPYAVAAALKLFLRKLPEPVIPFAFYDDLMAMAPALRDATEETIVSSPLCAMLDKLPECHRDLLAFLCEFIHIVASHADKNKMVLPNLAIVFAPNMLRPKEEDIGSALQLPIVNGVMLELIRYSRVLFKSM